jgi:hypothetical protein
MNRSISVTLRLALICGAVVGGCGVFFWGYLAGMATHEQEDRYFGSAGLTFPQILPQVRAALDDGEYAFFPNRRSIWVINTTNGRMANYLFRDDEVGSVDRSRVALINLKTFPPEDTLLQMSDRNYVNILWVGNKRTGDVQMWRPGRDGVLRAEDPIATSVDLMDRAPGAKRP